MATESVSTRPRSFFPSLTSMWFYSYCLSIILFSVPYNGPKLSEAGSNVLLPPGSRRCACAGDTLTFNCTVVGVGVTQWNGTAFDCTDTLDEILLLHNNFDTPEGANGRCNGGQIMGISLIVNNNCYTSQLSVTTSVALNNKTIRCIHNNEVGQMIPIGKILLTIISAAYSEPPANVALRKIQNGVLTFTWSPVDPTDCALEVYNITSEGCGTCTRGNNNSATCTDLQLSVNPILCTFCVQSVVCEFSGTLSNSTVVNLKVPDTSSIQEILPIYASNTQSLTKVAAIVNQTITFFFADNIPGPVTMYSFMFLPDNTTVPVNQSICDNSNICEYKAEVPKSVCSLTTYVGVAVSAANQLGQGPSSQPNMFGCSNQFVRVEYDSDASTITCVFLNTGSQNGNHMCSIRYGSCQQEFSHDSQGSTTVEFPDRVVIQIKLSGSECYVYSVKASNGTFSVIVEGNINTGSGGESNTTAIVIGTLVSLVIIIIVVACVVAAVVFCVKHFKREAYKFEVTDTGMTKAVTDNNDTTDDGNNAGNDDNSETHAATANRSESPEEQKDHHKLNQPKPKPIEGINNITGY